MAEPVPVGLWSETAPLTACITCAPGDEFDCMAPRHIEALEADARGRYRPNPDYLLFDDLVLLPHLQAEHAQLVDVIRAVTGRAGCLDLRSMLQRVLADASVAATVIEEVLELEGQCGTAKPALERARHRLRELGAAELVQALASGTDPETGFDLLRWPMPNWMFARDCWAVVGSGIVVGYPRLNARKRDGILARALLRHHPRLQAAPKIDVRAGTHGVSSDEGRDERCVEGGDILVVSRDLVLIGVGARTTLTSALTIAQELRALGVRHVLGVFIPERRATMHLDTLMTMLDEGLCLMHVPAFASYSDVADRVRVVDLAEPERDLGCNLAGVLGEFGCQLHIVTCGDGDSRAAAREQWTDGANAFALGPGRVVLYGRNTWTLRALNRAGFEVLTPEQFVPNADLLMSGHRRVVVALTGSELSRGRGGPRCLTLPIARAG